MRHRLYKISYVITILCSIGIVITLLIGWKNSLIKEDQNPINEIRLKVNPEYLLILDNWPLSNDVQKQLDEELKKENIACTVTDLNGYVLYKYNSQFELGIQIDLVEHMYYDYSYKVRNEGKHLISYPIYNQESVEGYVLFEVAINNRNDGMKMPSEWIISISLFSILFVISIIATIINHKKQTTNEFEELIEGLNHVSKGIFKPLKLPKESREQSIYISYNRMVEELSYLMKKKQSYEGQRKSFLTTISHELKTPIATINAYIEGLVSGVAKDEATRLNYQIIIQDKMKNLMNQVEDLFKYAQEDMNQFKYNFEEIYADEVFDKILKQIIDKENKRKIIIKNNIPKCMINVDVIRIEQVILNFYNNAIKHTPENGTLILETYRQDHELLISVEDNGEGIDARDLPYIFDYYYQGQASKKSDYEGVGLGLAICKEIINRHGGRIFVKSSLGKGTKISFTLPVV
ncbi:HAMP domain-containing histidine kinase [Mycoplasmatota bacterium]|nr:HAMP domain-containing histidine kinase [Mycoplasmatota bacterium]